MEKNERTKRKSYNRVQKEQRDFDTLFNAEIDIQARERRQQKRKRRKTSKLSRMFAAIIKASRFCFSKPAAQQKATSSEVPASISAALPELPASAPAALPGLSKPTVLTETPISAMPAAVVKPERKKKRKKKQSFFTGFIGSVRKFYAELTDKALIAKLREEPEDSSFNVFAEIRESLENTPVDAIITQNQQEVEDGSGEAQLQLEIIEEQVHYTDAPVEEEPVVSELLVDPEEQPEGREEETLSADEISAVVEIMFSGPQDGQQQIEEYEQVLIPEVVEAMKEIDYEHVMGLLEPKLATAMDQVDRFLDRLSAKSKRNISSAATWTHGRIRRIFCNQQGNPTVIATVSRKIKSGMAAGYHKAILPCAVGIKKGTLSLAGTTQKGIQAVSSKLARNFVHTSQTEEERNVSRFRVWCNVIETRFSKEKSLRIVAGVSILFVGLFFGRAVYLEHISAYEVYFLSSPIGIVKEKSDVLNILPIIEENLEKETGADIYIDASEDFTFELVRSSDLNILTDKQIQAKLEDINKINVAAYALKIDGHTMTILTQKEQIENLLSSIRDEYMADQNTSDFESVDFGENVEIVPVQAKMMQISDVDEAKKYLMMGTTEEKVHVVASGDTLSGIAQKYGIKTSEVISANPDVDPTKLQINQQISLIAPKPFITVQTKEISTYIAQVPFDIVYEESQNLFKGETTVKSAGKAGERQVTAEVMKQNGVEIGRVELESTILKDPVNQVVIKGSKPLPLLLGTGKFQNPVRGTLSSRYGQRWSKMHQGIDIAASKGTSISAADGGTVIYAGYDGSYGNVVRINHGANKVTVYAHCSKILVKQNQKVAKGQQIATVGTTGRTTGPHLHFEVRISGKAVNPLEYVKY